MIGDAHRNYGAPVDLPGYLAILRRRWIPLVACLGASLVLAAAVTALSPKRYRATTRLFVNIPAATDLREALQGVQLSAQLLESYAELATSRTAAAAIAAQVEGVTAGDVRSRLTAEAQPDTLLVDLSVVDDDRARAKAIADAAASTLAKSIRDLGPSPERAVEARVIDPAVATSEPVTPRPKRNAMAGLVVGLGAGIALAFALESMARSREEREGTASIAAVAPVPADEPPSTATVEELADIRNRLDHIAASLAELRVPAAPSRRAPAKAASPADRVHKTDEGPVSGRRRRATTHAGPE